MTASDFHDLGWFHECAAIFEASVFFPFAKTHSQCYIANMIFSLKTRTHILMTAVTFVLGTYPLVIATGACAVSRRSLGTTVFGGMTLAVVVGTILIPVFFVFTQLIVEKVCRKKTDIKN